MASNTATIKFKDTGITITCQSAEEAFKIYWDMGHRPGFIINGEELKKKGPTGPHEWWAGYTRDFFKRYFPEDPKEETA